MSFFNATNTAAVCAQNVSVTQSQKEEHEESDLKKKILQKKNVLNKFKKDF